jgi:hypothetical protein
MIHLLFVRRGVEMHVQGVDGVELIVAHIALPVEVVECTVGSRVFDILFLVPFNLFVGDGAMRITLSNHAKDGFAVKLRGVRAGTCFDVVGEAAGGGVVDLAERAGDIGAAVDL